MSVLRAETHFFLQKRPFFDNFGADLRAGNRYFRKKKTQFFSKMFESENNRLLINVKTIPPVSRGSGEKLSYDAETDV